LDIQKGRKGILTWLNGKDEDDTDKRAHMFDEWHAQKAG
jgi:hypothetical protein